MKEIFRKLHNYDVRIRKEVNSPMAGEFKSVFKGTGLEFDDVRPYQYGDDTRHIDWNVTAKGHGAYIKTFIEEKDQTVFILSDYSHSNKIGKEPNTKQSLITELSAVLGLTASNSGSQVGGITFTDEKEMYIKPSKGKKHAYFYINELYKHKTKHSKTDIDKVLSMTMSLVKKKSIVFIISDFIDSGFEKSLQTIGNKHDVVVLHTYDKQEMKMPRLGILPIKDPESGKITIKNSLFGLSKKKELLKRFEELESICKKNQIDYINIRSDEDYVSKLVQLFRKRNATKKRG